MDRNSCYLDNIEITQASLSARRAWIEMPWGGLGGAAPQGSLSARRAWIEIKKSIDKYVYVWVALRKESVDRNRLTKKNRLPVSRSLSARRAWIEIFLRDVSLNYKEGRSPQGERG